MIKPSKFHHGAFSRVSMAVVVFSMLARVVALGAETKSPDGMDDAESETTKVKRDPFWPVGYLPESVKGATEAGAKKAVRPTVGNDWNAAMKKVVINGVSSRSDDEFYAVINGQIKSVGDSVAVSHEGMIYTWAVEGIKPPGSVKLRRVSAL